MDPDKTFGGFLRKHGLVPPNQTGQDYDEETIAKEGLAERRDEMKDWLDHQDDRTLFEVTVCNRRDQAVNIDCSVHNGEITFGKVKVYSDKGLEKTK